MWKSIKTNPSKSAIYLVTKTDGTNKACKKRWIDTCRYSVEIEKWYCTEWDKVIAWKPLPEVFKGEWK